MSRSWALVCLLLSCSSSLDFQCIGSDFCDVIWPHLSKTYVHTTSYFLLFSCYLTFKTSLLTLPSRFVVLFWFLYSFFFLDFTQTCIIEGWSTGEGWSASVNHITNLPFYVVCVALKVERDKPMSGPYKQVPQVYSLLDLFLLKKKKNQHIYYWF